MKELEIIDKIRRKAGKPGGSLKIGIGDDCAVIKYTKNKYLLWAQDMLIEGTHFTLKNDNLELIGRKAVNVNISDIAAMGGSPEYILVSIGVPKSFRKREIGEIYKGILKACGRYGIMIAGGDTNRSGKLIIDVSITGFVRKTGLVTRSGAKKGDKVFITGPVRNGKKDHLTFRPRLKESRVLTKNYKINAMIDTSDGIAPDIYRICSQSNVGCILDEKRIPLSKNLSLKDALNYGESFELLFTMNPKEAKRLIKTGGDKKINCFEIGSIEDKKNGLKIAGKNKSVRTLKIQGYEHI